MKHETIAEWVRPIAGWRCAARIVRRLNPGVGIGFRAVRAHDEFPEDGGHLWLHGMFWRWGFGFGVERRVWEADR